MRIRFSVPLLFGLVVAASGFAGTIERLHVDHAYVRDLAAALVEKPYRPPPSRVPRFFRSLDYDKFRLIRFRPERALWGEDPLQFRVQFFHPGYIHRNTIDIAEFTETHVQDVPFSNQMFDYQNLHVPFWSRRGIGYAGFRVLNELNAPGKWDELVSFLGASYFRALGRNQRYGISARGLAINSGGPEPEEFPSFIEFWLGKPEPNSRVITIHALLTSQSATGAYTFMLTPGDTTHMDVRATLFFRKAVAGVGIAPMSSMFWFGEASQNRYGDFRPEVHDSDGFLFAPDAGTRLWRPLTNPAELRRTDFDAPPSFIGFGLMQRDRELRDYEDLEALYNLRPSLWVEPVGPWPDGKVRLVEIPTNSEYGDNIVAFWTPDVAFPPKTPVELHWRLEWTVAPTFGGPPGWVRSTRQSVAQAGDGKTTFVIDFDGASLSGLPKEEEITTEVSTVTPAVVEKQQVIRNEHDGSVRLVITFAAPPGSPPCELRARLSAGGKPVTETWVTTWNP